MNECIGRANDGKTWKFNRDINKLLEYSYQLLHTNTNSQSFFLLTCHDENYNENNLKQLLQQYFMSGKITSGSMQLQTNSNIENKSVKGLPLGNYVRWVS